jgi:hypothetical protein
VQRKAERVAQAATDAAKSEAERQKLGQIGSTGEGPGDTGSPGERPGQTGSTAV